LVCSGFSNLILTRSNIRQQARKVTLLLLVLLLPALIYSVQRNKVWSSSLSLYRADIVNLPRSMKAHSLLATEYTSTAFDYQRTGNIQLFADIIGYADSAQHHFLVATEIYPYYANSWNNLGVIAYNFLSNTRQSMAYFRRALLLDPHYEEAMFNLINGYGRIVKHYVDLSSLVQQSGSVINESILDMQDFRRFEAVETSKGFFQSFQILNQIEAVSSAIWSKATNMDIVQSYLRFVVAITQTDHHNRLDALSDKLSQISSINPSDHHRVVLGAISGERRGLLAEWINLHRTNQVEFAQYAKMGAQLYRDSFYLSCQELYTINPKYMPLYTAISTVASVEGNHEVVINWGHKFITHFPDQKGQGYAQLGSGHRAMNNADSSRFYFLKAIEEKQTELSKLRAVASEKRDKYRIQQVNNELVQIQQILATLKEE
jgi:tetratricopeptide (TPR) repeat protein